jgi:hypothetical protein
MPPAGEQTMNPEPPFKACLERNFLAILEPATQEVFEIMLGCQVKAANPLEHELHGGLTAIVGLAGALCGVVTVRCAVETAGQIARGMLGDASASETQVADALGEMCNMIAGNFESGSAVMKSTSVGAFDRVASLLRTREYRLRIEGHTDNSPIHTAQFPSNWELSTSRATEIVRLLIVRNGFSPDRLSAGGFAEYQPIASNRTAEGRGINRRVDIVILGRASREAATVPLGTEGQTISAMPKAAPSPASSRAILQPTSIPPR